MGEAGRDRAAREFGWDAVARRTVRVYEEILKF
jgi:starch synthase